MAGADGVGGCTLIGICLGAELPEPIGFEGEPGCPDGGIAPPEPELGLNLSNTPSLNCLTSLTTGNLLTPGMYEAAPYADAAAVTGFSAAQLTAAAAGTANICANP